MNTTARRFEPAEVREILRLRTRMTPKEIAEKYGTTRLTITRILTGQSYRPYTHRDDGPCHCPACATTKRAEETMVRFLGLTGPIDCLYCEQPTTTTVSVVLAQHGMVCCPRCDGRKP